MKLLVGLGNPGDRYQNNRHNVGFMFIDYIAPLLHCSIVEKNKTYITMKQSDNETIILIKPQTFMNNSGAVVKKLLSNFKTLKLSNLIVIHDDLDIPLGKFKIQQGVGPKLHNGIESIERELGRIPSFAKASEGRDFWRVRIGVDNRRPDNRIAGEDYVLQDFKKDENEIISRVFEKAAEALSQMINN